MLLKEWLTKVKQKDLFPGNISLRHSFWSLHEKECDDLNDRKTDLDWCKKWKVEELIHEIKKHDVADEDEYFCYLTEDQARMSLHVSKEELNKIVEVGKEQKRIVVLEKKDKRRICYALVRKFPAEML